MMQVLLYGFVGMLSLTLVTWIISVYKRDASIVDSVWSIFFLVAGSLYYLSADVATLQHDILLVLLTIWALRLSIYISWRNHGKPEDSRYRDIRVKYSPRFWIKSLFIIFIFQAVLAVFISLPLWYVFTHATALGISGFIGIALWFIGMYFESVADMQLARFKKSEAGRSGGVLDTGLWRYSRHPNYFGEACIWWGFYLLAVDAGGWWTILSPVLMTWLLLKFSGVVLLEKDIVERRPQYRAYIESTNAFIPWRPKTAINSSVTGEVTK